MLNNSYDARQIKELSLLIQSKDIGLYVLIGKYYGLTTPFVKNVLKSNGAFNFTINDVSYETQEDMILNYCKSNSLEMPQFTPIDPFSENEILDRIIDNGEIEHYKEDIQALRYAETVDNTLSNMFEAYKSNFSNDLTGSVNNIAKSLIIEVEDKKMLINAVINRLDKAIKENIEFLKSCKTEYIQTSLQFLNEVYNYTLSSILKTNAKSYSNYRKLYSSAPQKKTAYLETLGTHIEYKILLGILKDKKLIHKETKEPTIKNIFNKDNLSIIKWTGTKSSLCYLLQSLYSKYMLVEPKIGKWKNAQLIFKDSYGYDIVLGKNKPKDEPIKMKKTIDNIILTCFSKK